MADFATPGADAFLNGTALPATLYVQGHTGDPGTNGTANVAAETDRIVVAAWTAAGAGATGYRAKSNTAVCDILNAAANETWTHVTYWSAASGGTCWFIDDIANLTVAVADTIRLDIGASIISVPIWT